jgi:hypothetical protein
LATAVLTGEVAAQSLEGSYAALCGNATAATSETCVALRKALSEKRAGLPAQPTAVSRKQWGLWLDMVGKQWFGGFSDLPLFVPNPENYEEDRWVVPGEKFESRYFTADGKNTVISTVHIDPAAGRLVHEYPSGSVAYSAVQPDGSIIQTTPMGDSTYRMVMRRLDDGSIETSSDKITGQAIEHLATFVLFERTPAGIATWQGIIRQKEIAAQQQAERAAAEKREAAREKSARFDAVMGALQSGLEQANDVASAHEAESRAELDATLAQAAQQASTAHGSIAAGHAQGSSDYQSASAAAQQRAAPSPVVMERNIGSAATAAAGTALRFVLDISLVNKPGDTVNPTCYSNVITRPGPPGWGGGSLPAGSAEQAREAVESLKSRFIALCRASGRDITSEGDFHWTWNETREGDQQVSNAHARYREDVSVNL